MKKTISMVKLLTMIKDTKYKVNTLYSSFIDPSTSNDSRLFATICNDSTRLTMNGYPIGDTVDEITSIDKLISSSIDELQKLQVIKDGVNSISKIKIPVLENMEESIEVSVYQALMINSPKNKEYRIGYIDRLNSDYIKIRDALDKYNKSSLSQDKIDTYVNARLGSVNVNLLNDINAKNNLYRSLSKEYIDANKFIIKDPLDIASTIHDKKKRIIEYFEAIDVAIKEFNATTKIWIDLDSDTDFWGFID